MNMYTMLGIVITVVTCGLEYFLSFEAAVLLWCTAFFFLFEQLLSKVDRNYLEIKKNEAFDQMGNSK